MTYSAAHYQLDEDGRTKKRMSGSEVPLQQLFIPNKITDELQKKQQLSGRQGVVAVQQYYGKGIERRRINLEAQANSHRLFLGENDRPLRLSSRRIDQGGQGQYFSNLCFGIKSSLASILYIIQQLSGSIVDMHPKDVGLKLI